MQGRIGALIHRTNYCTIAARFRELLKSNLIKQGRAMRQVTEFKLAERQGFEPWVQVLARTTV